MSFILDVMKDTSGKLLDEVSGLSKLKESFEEDACDLDWDEDE